MPIYIHIHIHLMYIHLYVSYTPLHMLIYICLCTFFVVRALDILLIFLIGMFVSYCLLQEVFMCTLGTSLLSDTRFANIISQPVPYLFILSHRMKLLNSSLSIFFCYGLCFGIYRLLV